MKSDLSTGGSPPTLLKSLSASIRMHVEVVTTLIMNILLSEKKGIKECFVLSVRLKMELNTRKYLIMSEKNALMLFLTQLE